MGRAGSTSKEGVTRGGDRGLRIVLAFVVGSLTLATASADPAALHSAQGELAPDLAPVSVTVNPSSPREGDVLHVSVNVANGGLGLATSATIDLIDFRPNDDVVPIGRTPLSGPLAPGASVHVSMEPAFVATVPGEHTLMVRVEDVMPDEGNRDNDVLTVQMMIQPAGGVPPPAPSAGGFGVAVLEDLRFVTVLGAIAVVLFAAIAILLRRRPELVGLLPPPPDPPDQIPPPIWPP